jgi:hypothetical protein
LTVSACRQSDGRAEGDLAQTGILDLLINGLAILEFLVVIDHPELDSKALAGTGLVGSSASRIESGIFL